MRSYAEALSEFYHGEVYGEALFSALVASARNADERLKWGMLLQLETETKAWLRAPMVAHGVSIEERKEDRDRGLAMAPERGSLPWPQLINALIRNDDVLTELRREFGIREEESSSEDS